MRDPRITRGGGRRRHGWGDDQEAGGWRPGPPPGAPFGPDGPPWGRGGGRTRRGDIRTALLFALTQGPGHGYELIQRLEERTGGRWRPSPGSVYPTLQLLEDEGLAESTEQDGKRTYAVTEAGQTELRGRMQRPDGAPWAFRQADGAADGDADPREQLRAAVGHLHMAARQVASAGTAEQIATAVEAVTEVRKRLYQLLAES